MILVAPDKYKGTLSAKEAADIMASTIERLSDIQVLKAPMADGGEGTAAILCSSMEWEEHGTYYVNPSTRTAVIDSSAVIGLQGVNLATHDILKASSAPLGIKVREIIKGGCEKVIIGIGGTATCDGGMGFIEALGVEKLCEYKHKLIGLSDVRVPLVAQTGEPSALMFARQKGASDLDINVLYHRLKHIYAEYPHQRSPYDGAGGGLGFAIASVIGAVCHDGAQYVIDNYNIDWPAIDMIVTGEGSIDEQSAQGKVVGTLSAIGQRYGIPVVAFGGIVQPGLVSDTTINTSAFYPELPLNHNTAVKRLETAVGQYFRAKPHFF